MTLGTTKSTVWPSGGDFEVAACAMLPCAPGWLSTMFGCPVRSASPAAMMRVTTSAGPPGAKGTSQRIGFVGQAGSCAHAPPATSRSNTNLTSTEKITPLFVSCQPFRRAQAFQLTHDLATVAAGARGHQLAEELRPVGKRGLQRVEALAVEARRLRHAVLELALAQRQGEIEAGLRARARAVQGRIERQRAHPGVDH